MSDATKAVFLSYASQDAEAARRIAETLRAAGVEVWFDQDELVGGDAWDAKIRGQIGSCALFIPIISAHTQARHEGYFRLEWKLAEDRSHLMAKGVPFIVPVTIDATTERGALVPDAFLAVQWTKLSGGETTPAFASRVQKLLGTTSATLPATPSQNPAPMAKAASAKSGLPPWIAVALGAATVALITYVALRPAGREIPAAPVTKAVVESKHASAPTPPLAPEKSVAVLPFENLSPDKDDALFADGVHLDVITSLTKIRDIKKVIGRTSVLAYRDPATRNHKQIAADLGVATLLEGTVRRAGTKVRVTAQLINARTDESLWAETYDLELTDVFTIQSALAQNITAALKANFTTGERAYVAERPTQNQEAYDLYSRARLLDQALPVGGTRAQYDPVVALYEQAVALDPGFALAFAQLTRLLGRMYWFNSVDPTPARRARAQAALEAAQRLAPTAPETGFARGMFAYYCDADWKRAFSEYANVEPSLPNDAQLHLHIGSAERRLGHGTKAAVRFERAVALNPQDLGAATSLIETLNLLRRYPEARALANRFLTLFPDDSRLRFVLLQTQFAIDGDRATYLRGYPSLSLNGNATDPNYRLPMLKGDYAASDQVLGDLSVSTFVNVGSANATGGAVGEPSVLLRAEIAFLRSQPDLARKYADEAIAYYRAGSWTRRQQSAVPVEIARAEALAGRVETALRDGPGAVARFIEFDPAAAGAALPELGRIYLICGKSNEALECLRRSMMAPGPSANEIRLDPIWSRLKDDPRFEEILKSAKVF